MWYLWKASPAVPDHEFQAREGHHIVGLSMKDGKPMGIIVAPMEAIGCCEKMLRTPRGQNMCPKKYNNSVKYVCRNASHLFINIFHMRSTLLKRIISIIMHTKARSGTPNHLNNMSRLIKFARSLTSIGRCWPLRGAFERGAPQSPIANSRHKKATTLWVCPWEANVHYWGTYGGHWGLRKNVSWASGTTHVSEIVPRTATPLIIEKTCLQKYVTSSSQHCSYVWFAL